MFHIHLLSQPGESHGVAEPQHVVSLPHLGPNTDSVFEPFFKYDADISLSIYSLLHSEQKSLRFSLVDNTRTSITYPHSLHLYSYIGIGIFLHSKTSATNLVVADILTGNKSTLQIVFHNNFRFF